MGNLPRYGTIVGLCLALSACGLSRAIGEQAATQQEQDREQPRQQQDVDCSTLGAQLAETLAHLQALQLKKKQTETAPNPFVMIGDLVFEQDPAKTFTRKDKAAYQAYRDRYLHLAAQSESQTCALPLYDIPPTRFVGEKIRPIEPGDSGGSANLGNVGGLFNLLGALGAF